MTALPLHVGEDLVWAERLGEPRRAPALFLDRDGVIVEEVHYLREPAKLRLIPGAAEAIRRARERGLHVVVVTNQSGIGRGLYGWPDFMAVQERMIADLARRGAGVDAVLACPFCPDVAPPYGHPDHPARKPNPGMLLAAARMLDAMLAESWIVGDRAGDLAAGRNAGLAGGLHVATGVGAAQREQALALARADFQVLTADSIADAPAILPVLAH